MDAPSEFQPLIDEIFREKVRRARAHKNPAILSLEGFELFEFGLGWIRAGLRGERSDVSEAEVEAEIQRRLSIRRRIDERDLYLPAA